MSVRALVVAALPLLAAAQELPISGLAGVGVMTADLTRAREFYSGTLGYSEAFSLKNTAGQVVSAFFKVNDEQYIQVIAGPYGDIRMAYMAILTPDAQGLRKMLMKRGFIPGPPARSPDGNLAFSLKDPDGARIDFVERTPDSLQAKAAGKFTTAKRISQHLWHAGVVSADADRSLAFYGGRLGFQEIWRGGPRDNQVQWINMKMPGRRGDYLELMLSPELPSREQYGALQHICLQVPDVRAAIAQLIERGYEGPEKLESRIGRNGRRQVNLYDPGGTRIELMEPRPPR